MVPPQEVKRRWYDRHPEVSYTVEMLLGVPQEFQTILADGLILLGELHFNSSRLLSNLKSLGSEKVLSLYQTKKKRRYADKNDIVHQSLNHLFVLPEIQRVRLSLEMNELFHLVVDYLRFCKRSMINPSHENVSLVTNTYIQKGTLEVHKLLYQLDQEVQRTVRLGAPDRDNVIIIESDGMSLKERVDSLEAWN